MTSLPVYYNFHPETAIIFALKNAPDGLTKSMMAKLFKKHPMSSDLESVAEKLVNEGKIQKKLITKRDTVYYV